MINWTKILMYWLSLYLYAYAYIHTSPTDIFSIQKHDDGWLVLIYFICNFVVAKYFKQFNWFSLLRFFALT